MTMDLGETLAFPMMDLEALSPMTMDLEARKPATAALAVDSWEAAPWRARGGAVASRDSVAELEGETTMAELGERPTAADPQAPGGTTELETGALPVGARAVGRTLPAMRTSTEWADQQSRKAGLVFH